MKGQTTVLTTEKAKGLFESGKRGKIVKKQKKKTKKTRTKAMKRAGKKKHGDIFK